MSGSGERSGRVPRQYEPEALIPLPDREPAKPPARRVRIARPRSGTRQLSLFGAEARRPEAGDLAGLLAGPGRVVRMGGTARVSIVVDEPWRAVVLVAELGRRGLLATWADARARRRPARELTLVEDPWATETPPTREEPEADPPEGADTGYEVHTAYTAILNDLAAAWLAGTAKRSPADLLLDGRALRLWAIAAGRQEDDVSYLLGLDGGDAACWPAVGAALGRVGLRAELTGEHGPRPGYRIIMRGRLAELVGEAPKQAPPGLWPS